MGIQTVMGYVHAAVYSVAEMPYRRGNLALMQTVSVVQMGDRLLESVPVGSGRASEAVYGDKRSGFKQSVMALKTGAELSEHRNPGDATALVLRGAAVLMSGADSWHGTTAYCSSGRA